MNYAQNTIEDQSSEKPSGEVTPKETSESVTPQKSNQKSGPKKSSGEPIQENTPRKTNQQELRRNDFQEEGRLDVRPYLDKSDGGTLNDFQMPIPLHLLILIVMTIGIVIGLILAKLAPIIFASNPEQGAEIETGAGEDNKDQNLPTNVPTNSEK